VPARSHEESSPPDDLASFDEKFRQDVNNKKINKKKDPPTFSGGGDDLDFLIIRSILWFAFLNGLLPAWVFPLV
jgi:hypothetical protein